MSRTKTEKLSHTNYFTSAYRYVKVSLDSLEKKQEEDLK